LKRLSGTGKAKAKFEKYQSKSEVRQYPTKEDSTLPTPILKKRKHSDDCKKKQLKNLLGSPSLKIKKNNKCACKTFNKHCEIKLFFQ
jgi:nucleolar protein 58